MCERFVNFLFNCSAENPVRIGVGQRVAPRLAHFIAYSLYRTRLPPEVTFGTLLLLQRLKERFPFARGSAGHPLFLSAFMLASKSLCDDTYSNKSWVIVGQDYFSLVEVNHMERELFSFLDFQVAIAPEDLMALAHALNDPFLSLDECRYRVAGPTHRLPTPKDTIQNSPPPSNQAGLTLPLRASTVPITVGLSGRPPEPVVPARSASIPILPSSRPASARQYPTITTEEVSTYSYPLLPTPRTSFDSHGHAPSQTPKHQLPIPRAAALVSSEGDNLAAARKGSDPGPVPRLSLSNSPLVDCGSPFLHTPGEPGETVVLPAKGRFPTQAPASALAPPTAAMATKSAATTASGPYPLEAHPHWGVLN